MGLLVSAGAPLAASLLLSACGRGLPDEPKEETRSAAVVGAGLPEIPSLLRDVSLVEGGRFKRPVIPPLRTSNDGRVGVSLKKIDGKVAFYLLRPESLSGPFSTSAPGVHILASPTPYDGGLAPTQFHQSRFEGQLIHSTLCDGTTQQSATSEPKTPRTCGRDGAQDCYDLSVISSFVHAGDGASHVELWKTPITVWVSDPKTASATISRVTTGAPVAGPTLAANTFLEPTVTADGRMLVARLDTPRVTWTNPENGSRLTQHTGIVYSVYPETDAPCDVTKWTDFHPISHAPYDSRMRPRYGIAQYPFRDTEGNPVPDGVDIKGTYPWMDRDGSNLFYAAVGATLFYEDPASGAVSERYPAACVAGEPCVEPKSAEDIGKYDANDEPTRGHAFVGLWSHGKMVLMDNLINNTDYGFGRSDEMHRMLSLYEPGTAPPGVDPSGIVRVGAGRDESGMAVPPGASPNTAFIDSTENVFNHAPALVPLAVRDVVWTINTGKASAEVVFDEHLAANGFINSDMSASLTLAGGPIVAWQDYHDGFEQTSPTGGRGFTRPIRVQNSATAVAARWVIPSYGVVQGGARVEPVALGGIAGKGLWLAGDGDDRIEYAIAAQPQDVAASPWYVGIFVDARSPDDAVERHLLTFPDRSRIVLKGRSEVLYETAAGAQVGRAVLPSGGLGYQAWAHLGILVKDGGAKVELYLDGFLYDIWTSRKDTLFRMVPGTLTVGAYPGSHRPGFRGWIDELKVIAEAPNPEVICNHARGTLVGMSPSDTGAWQAIAARYPESSHALISDMLVTHGASRHARYACYHDYASDFEASAHLGNLPAGESVRKALLFPESPLVYGRPRPDSSANDFCRSCHVAEQPESLSLSALTFDAGMNLEDDSRRQPTQPLRLIFGNVPAGLVAPGKPATPQQSPPSGLLLDQWVY